MEPPGRVQLRLVMFGTIMHGPGDVRFEQVEDLKILKPTDAIIKLSVTCVCGSDLWPYRGLQPNEGPAHMGHEYCGLLLTPLPRSDRMKGKRQSVRGDQTGGQ